MSPRGWDTPADLEQEPATIPLLADLDVPQALREEIEGHISHYPDRRSAALPALAAAQRVHGWCSPEAIEQVAAVMRLTPAYLESVASFYDMLETEPRGRHSIYVCTNISCSLCGADELYASFAEQAAEGIEGEPINVRSFECLGACDIAPMASVDGVYVGPLVNEDVPRVLEDLRAGRDVLPEKQLARRLVADPHANSEQFPQHPVHRLTLPADPEVPPERAAFGPPMGADRDGPTAPHEPQPEHQEEDKS
ncbi:MAG: NADH-quinone oxidoreductase subunit NuoE family protein [Solirubrobacteraceae bacterium]